MDEKLANAYLHASGEDGRWPKPPLSFPQTLDEFLNPQATSMRDLDQVVIRYATSRREVMDRRVLMVDQLWLWTDGGLIFDPPQCILI